MDLKYGDKVKIDLDSFLTRVNTVEVGDGYYNEIEIEYEYSIEEDDQKLLGYLFKNNTFTIDMVDIKKRYSSLKTSNQRHTIITLKELTNANIHVTFYEEELLKV